MTTKELNYKNYDKDHPSYEFYNINVADIANIQDYHKTEIDLPLDRVTNMYNTRLSYTINTTALDLPNFNYLHLNGIPQIKHIYLENDKGYQIGKVENVHKYTNMTFRYNNKMTNVNQWEINFNEGLTPNYSVNADIPNILHLEGFDSKWVDLDDNNADLASDPVTQTEVNTAVLTLVNNINDILDSFLDNINDFFNINVRNFISTDTVTYTPIVIDEPPDPLNVGEFNTIMNEVRTNLLAIITEISLFFVSSKIFIDIPTVSFTAFNVADTAQATLVTAYSAFITKFNNQTGGVESFYNYWLSINTNYIIISENTRLFLNYKYRPDLTKLVKNDECRYLECLTDINEINYNFNLGKFKDSYFGVNKDIYYGVSNRMKLIIIWNGFNTSLYENDNTDYSGQLDINDIQLKLCIEKNPLISQEVKNKVNEGMEITTPFLYCYKENINSTLFNKFFYFDKTYGIRLNKIYFASYDDTTHNNSEYERNDIQTFYTSINDNRTRLQDYNTSTYDDYFELKHKLKESCILSANEYYYNHTFIQDFTYDKFSDDNDNLIDGYELNKEVMKYTLNLNLLNNSGTFYMYAVTQRKLKITNNDLLFS